LIEVEVHSALLTFLRSQENFPIWHHHLTMARLVARALRLRRSALIQTGMPNGSAQINYSLSYLAPALIWSGGVIVVAPEIVQQQLRQVAIPQWQQWTQIQKDIQMGDRWPDPNFQGLLLTSPAAWLADRLGKQERFPSGIPTIIDGVDDLEDWAREQLTVSIQPGNWDELMLKYPHKADLIRDARVQLTKAVFQHPANPYKCCLIAASEQNILLHLYEGIGDQGDGEAGRINSLTQNSSQSPIPSSQSPVPNPQSREQFSGSIL
jgi:ATP-dependent DNA helicase DinG